MTEVKKGNWKQNAVFLINGKVNWWDSARVSSSSSITSSKGKNADVLDKMEWLQYFIVH